MSPKLPAWLRLINWTVIFLTVLWIVYDRILQPWTGWPLVFPTVVLYHWLRDLAALALVIGLLHVLFVHVRRVWRAQTDWGYSLALLLMTTGVVTMGLGDRAGLSSTALQWIYAYVLVPAEAALMASTLFVLAGALWVAVRLRRRGMRWLLLGLLPVLTLQMPWINAHMPAPFAPYLDNALHLVATPVMRGLLLGTGLLLFATTFQYLLGLPDPQEPDA